jgi:hypothetical protein
LVCASSSLPLAGHHFLLTFAATAVMEHLGVDILVMARMAYIAMQIWWLLCAPGID